MNLPITERKNFHQEKKNEKFIFHMDCVQEVKLKGKGQFEMRSQNSLEGYLLSVIHKWCQKKPLMCQIMGFSLHCINGSIEAETSIRKTPITHF